LNNESKKYHLLTLGCAKNQVDSEAIEAELISAGLESTDRIGSADLILVNSCGFINDAKIETIDTVLQCHNRRKSGSVLAICGCLPARYDLRGAFEEVDIFLPSDHHGCLIEKLNDMGWGLSRREADSKRLYPSAPYGYLKISEGCDNFCSYCAIPFIKGKFTSRPAEEIIREAQFLVGGGARELILIGQDTTLYGKDNEDCGNLVNLFDLLADVDGCDWIRLMYAHPAHLDAAMIDAISSHEKIVNYIDLPLQHISDRILQAMNRKTSRGQIESLIEKLRSEIPGITLRTTFMVGFPGETDREFAELLDFCEGVRFDSVGIFKYSSEDGTSAEKLAGRVSDGDIEQRYLTLLDLQNMISGELLIKRLGTREKVLLQEIDTDGKRVGRARYQAPEVDGQVIVENCSGNIGEYEDVVIQRSDAYDLYGIPAGGGIC
jgi:ribosomal protein S12 methylthiotransferase